MAHTRRAGTAVSLQDGARSLVRLVCSCRDQRRSTTAQSDMPTNAGGDAHAAGPSVRAVMKAAASSPAAPGIPAAVPTKPAPRKIGGLEDFAAGAVGGVGITAVQHPGDSLKVLMQAAPSRHSSVVETARHVLRQHGVRGLYRGVTAPLSTVALVNAIVFWGYGHAKRAMGVEGGSGDRTMALTQVGIAGAFGGLANAPIVGPVELAKIRVQMQNADVLPTASPSPATVHDAAARSSRAATTPTATPSFRSPAHALRHAYAHDGVRGVFRGSFANASRETCAYAAQFVVYEAMLRALIDGDKSATDEDSLSPGSVILAGGVSGLACWTFSYPQDVLKTRLQQLPPSGIPRGPLWKPLRYVPDGGMWECAKDTVRSSGWRGLWRGYTPCVLPAFPANAAGFAGYEATIFLFTRFLGYER